LTGQNRPLAAFDEMRRNGHRLFQRIASEAKIEDDARFLKSWLDRPLVTGAVSPSGKALATMMARYVDPGIEGPVIEIGPGTGPVTEALIRRGIDEARLILIEFNPDFCRLLRQRFPRARVIEGDAYSLAATLGELDEPAAAVVSSLPLFTKPEALRLGLLHTAFRLMHPGSPFIQFTYATVSPMPLRQRDFEAMVSPRVWLNLPPARVWIYRRP
jgi:phosphatidylethanolamine/phosphatidyl-N-methylethanolamine N-methyltransferase